MHCQRQRISSSQKASSIAVCPRKVQHLPRPLEHAWNEDPLDECTASGDARPPSQKTSTRSLPVRECRYPPGSSPATPKPRRFTRMRCHHLAIHQHHLSFREILGRCALGLTFLSSKMLPVLTAVWRAVDEGIVGSTSTLALNGRVGKSLPERFLTISLYDAPVLSRCHRSYILPTRFVAPDQTSTISGWRTRALVHPGVSDRGQQPHLFVVL
ncbi:hypothetical protein BDV06DRAFT_19348 [Aspergillus oleicola]